MIALKWSLVAWTAMILPTWCVSVRATGLTPIAIGSKSTSASEHTSIGVKTPTWVKFGPSPVQIERSTPAPTLVQVEGPIIVNSDPTLVDGPTPVRSSPTPLMFGSTVVKSGTILAGEPDPGMAAGPTLVQAESPTPAKSSPIPIMFGRTPAGEPKLAEVGPTPGDDWVVCYCPNRLTNNLALYNFIN